MSVFVAAIADDDTGATDLAGMLTAEGMRAIVVLEGATAEELRRWSADADAVIVGTASRSITKEEAYARTRRAAEALFGLNPKVLAIKYCSTFDSTAEGNIGASIDAAMDVTGERFTVALPALPALGRMTYMGYHFVDDKLLSNSVLRNHPLNPMTNAHLPSHLSTQTRRRVALLPYIQALTVEEISEGIAQLKSEGAEIVLFDCIDEAHLERLGEAMAGMRLITGSSGWAMVLPEIWRRRGMLTRTQSGDFLPARKPGGSGVLIVSGSCSEKTCEQNAWAVSAGYRVVELKTESLLGQDALDSEVENVIEVLCGGGICVLSTGGAKTLEHVREHASGLGLSAVGAGERIAERLAAAVRRIVERVAPEGLIVAGGETSSSVMRTLALGGVRVGPNIDPGIPVCVALARPDIAVVLKSGNFGSQDFYGKAIDAIRGLPLYR